MDMSKKIRNVVALVLVVCVLMPVTAFPLQYAPGSTKTLELDGHSDPPVTVHKSRTIQNVSGPVFYIFTSPFGMIHFTFHWADIHIGIWWY